MSFSFERCSLISSLLLLESPHGKNLHLFRFRFYDRLIRESHDVRWPFKVTHGKTYLENDEAKMILENIFPKIENRPHAKIVLFNTKFFTIVAFSNRLILLQLFQKNWSSSCWISCVKLKMINIKSLKYQRQEIDTFFHQGIFDKVFKLYLLMSHFVEISCNYNYFLNKKKIILVKLPDIVFFEKLKKERNSKWPFD